MGTQVEELAQTFNLRAAEQREANERVCEIIGAIAVLDRAADTSVRKGDDGNAVVIETCEASEVAEETMAVEPSDCPPGMLSGGGMPVVGICQQTDLGLM